MTPAPASPGNHTSGNAPGAGIYRDAWGIPHLRATSADQLARLQGLNAATDRSWQIELERWRSEGRTAEHARRRRRAVGPILPPVPD